MPRLRDGLRAAVALAVLACAQPAFAQTERVKDAARPLDIKPILKSIKPVKTARKPKKPETPKPADRPDAGAAKPPEAPAGPTLASVSSTPVILPPADNPGAVRMVPELKPSLAPRRNLTRAEYDEMISKHAKANDVPDALVHRVVMRESRYQPWLVGSCRCYGLMQIKHGTARAMGYPGTASGLLDPDTNLTYAVKYLAGAYRKAKGNADRAIAYYARGY